MTKFRPLHTLLLFLIMAGFAGMAYAVTTATWTQTTFYPTEGVYNNTLIYNDGADAGLSFPVLYQGNGADSALTVAAPFNINTQTQQAGRAGSPDGVVWTITSVVGNGQDRISSTLNRPGGIAAGDEIMIITLQGSPADYAQAGLYEFKRVTGLIGDQTVIVDSPLVNYYNGVTNKVIVQRVPNYTNVTVNSGGNIWCSPATSRERPLARCGTSNAMGVYTAGYRFTPLSNGYITAIGRYVPPGGTLNNAVRLYSDGGVLLATGTTPSVEGWQYAYLATPVRITTGIWYRVVMYSSNNYLAYLPQTGWTNNSIYIDQGYSYSGGDVFPNNASGTNLYACVDIEFEPDGGSGVLAFRSNGTVQVNVANGIGATGTGFIGGSPGNCQSTYTQSTGGEGYAGWAGNGGAAYYSVFIGPGYSGQGGGGGGSDYDNDATVRAGGAGAIGSAGGGGGSAIGGWSNTNSYGYAGGGGGGGHGTAGTGGQSGSQSGGNGAGSTGGTGGQSFNTSGSGSSNRGGGGGGGGTDGRTDSSLLYQRAYLGAGGAAGGAAACYNGLYISGNNNGGAGGGFIFIGGNTINIASGASITSNGENGSNGGVNTRAYSAGGGGGAGGSICLIADLVANAGGAGGITANGGAGGTTAGGYSGGAGGAGRTFVRCNTFSGTVPPSNYWNDGRSNYDMAGTYISPLINPESAVLRYKAIIFTTSIPTSTTLTVDVLRGADFLPLATNVASGTDLSTLANLQDYTGSIRLRANLATTDFLVSPLLRDWSVSYETNSGGKTFISNQSGDWNNTATWLPSGVPGIGDTATIQSGNEITITATQFVRALTVTSGARLIFNNSIGTTSPRLLIDDKGVLTNNGAISATGTNSSYPAVLSSTGLARVTGASGLIASGVSGQSYVMSNLTIETPFITGPNSVIFSGSIYCDSTSGITITDNALARLELTANSFLRSRGGIDNAGFLVLGNNTRIEMDRTVALLAQIRNRANGVITATGASSILRDCRVYRSTTSIAGGRYEFYLDNDSSSLFLNCDIAGLERLYSDQVAGAGDGTQAGEGMTINSCNIHDSYTGGQTVSYGVHLYYASASVNQVGNTITNTNIYNINAGLQYNYGIFIQSINTAYASQHTIVGNTIYNIFSGSNSADGVYWERNATAAATVTFTNNTIYNCLRGMRFYLDNTTPVNIINCSFGAAGPNLSNDIEIAGGVTSRVEMRNCFLNSTTEVNNFTTLNCWVRSMRHDRVPGLVRIWGDYRAPGTENYRYDTELYSGAGDANVQKVMEFGVTTVPADTLESAATAILTGSRYIMTVAPATINIVGVVTSPVIIRSVVGTSAPYGFYVFRNNVTCPAVIMQYVEFNHINSHGVCLGGMPVYDVNNRKYVTISTFNYLTFKNSSGTSHLHFRPQTNLTFIGLSFDSSTTYDFTYGRQVPMATYTITLNDWKRQRAVASTLAMNATESLTITWATIGTTYTSVIGGYWNAIATWGGVGPPTANDTVTISAGNVVDVPGDGVAYPCRRLTINSGGYLRFRPGSSSGNAIFRIEGGSTLVNSGNICINGGAPYYAILEAIDPDNAETPFILTGNNILWNRDEVANPVNNAPWQVRMIDYRVTMNATQPAGITFTGPMWTQTVNVDQDCSVVFNPVTTATWIAAGNINVGTGSGSFDGVLQILGEANQGANLKIKCTSDGQYMLNIGANGTITATGASTTDRNATISSLDYNRGYVWCQGQSVSRFQYCELFNLGDLGSYDRNGLSVGTTGVATDGSVAGQFALVDNCTFHDSYMGVRITSCSNITAAYGQGVISSTFYNMANHCIYTYTVDPWNNGIRVSGNTLRDSGYGLAIGRVGGASSYADNTIYNMANYGIGILSDIDTVTLSNNIIYNCGQSGSLFNTGGVYYSNENGPYVSDAIFTGCNFGASGNNSPADVNMNPLYGGSGIGVGRLTLRNSVLASTNEVYWNPTALFAPTTYIVSNRHDGVDGATRIWGDYLVSSGTVNWNTTQPSYTGGTDAGAAKTVRFMTGPLSLNGGRSIVRLNSGVGLDMASGNSAGSRTTLSADNVSYPIDLIISGTVTATYYTLNNLGVNGFYITAPSASVSSLDYGNFQNSGGITGSAYLRLANASFGASRTVAGCEFDNSSTYDVRADVGSNTITMTGWTNDNAGTKDSVTGGSAVYWQPATPPNVIVSAANGNWTSGGVWVGGVPPTISMIGEKYSINPDISLDRNKVFLYSNRIETVK